MFKQLFATMNEALDDIISLFPSANGAKRKELEERLSTLKAMSDNCIEEWLLFEDKLGQMTGLNSPSSCTGTASAEPKTAKTESLMNTPPAVAAVKGASGGEKERGAGSFSKGQGFYKLSMYREAVAEFEQVVRREPEFVLARIYLAMSYLRFGEYADAYRHFKFLIPLTDDSKIKAISYNAMGCIQAKGQNMDKALEYWGLAHSADPASIEPVLNMKQWSQRD